MPYLLLLLLLLVLIQLEVLLADIGKALVLIVQDMLQGEQDRRQYLFTAWPRYPYSMYHFIQSLIVIDNNHLNHLLTKEVRFHTHSSILALMIFAP